MFRKHYLAHTILAALCLGGPVHAADYSRIVVFGDSLSDGGNMVPGHEYTTNPGQVTVQQLADKLGLPSLTASQTGGSDYAWGGAGVLKDNPFAIMAGENPSTLTQQITQYLATGSIDRQALYSVWGGANDIFYHAVATSPLGFLLPDGPETEAQATQALIQTAKQEITLIGQLQAAGAQNILVFNMPDIGSTPGASEMEKNSPGAQDNLTRASLFYNTQLNAELSQRGKGIIPVDVYNLFNEVMKDYQAYGFTNVKNPACKGQDTPTASQCGPEGSGQPYTYAPGTDQTYLFADGIHPTTGGHELLAEAVYAELEAPQTISLLSEAPLAATAAQARTLRNQMLVDRTDNQPRLFANVDAAQQHFSGPRMAGARSNNVTLTLGADVPVNPRLSFGLGLGLGHNSTDFSGGGGYVMQDFSGLAYLNYRTGLGLYMGAYGGFGQSHFGDINRVIKLRDYRRHENGKTDGWHAGAGLTGGWWFQRDAFKTGPFVTIEYQNIQIDGYSETSGRSTSMWFGRQAREALVSTAGWRVQGEYQLGPIRLVPYAEVAWNHDSREPKKVDAGLTTMAGSFADGFVPDKRWGTIDLSLFAQFSPVLSGWIGYSGRFSRANQTYDGLNVGMKYAF